MPALCPACRRLPPESLSHLGCLTNLVQLPCQARRADSGLNFCDPAAASAGAPCGSSHPVPDPMFLSPARCPIASSYHGLSPSSAPPGTEHQVPELRSQSGQCPALGKAWGHRGGCEQDAGWSRPSLSSTMLLGSSLCQPIQLPGAYCAVSLNSQKRERASVLRVLAETRGTSRGKQGRELYQRAYISPGGCGDVMAGLGSCPGGSSLPG